MQNWSNSKKHNRQFSEHNRLRPKCSYSVVAVNIGSDSNLREHANVIKLDDNQASDFGKP